MIIRRAVLIAAGTLALGGVSPVLAANPAPPPFGATASLVAIDVASGRQLIDIRGEQLGTPASVTKLVVAIAALELLGPDHRAHTVFDAGGPLRDGVLEGDLIVRAVADPTWTSAARNGAEPAPQQIARALKAAGLRRVDGNLVIDRSRFPGRAVPVERSWSDLGWGRGAPTSALAVDYNAVEIAIGPGPSVGAPAFARGPKWLTLINEMRTVGRERHDHGTVDALADPRGAAVILTGEYPISEPGWSVQVASPNPDLRAAEVLAEALRAQGIAVTGTVELGVPGVVVAGRGASLFGFASPPLIEWLRPMVVDSDNWMADMVLRHLGAQVSGSGRIDEAAQLISTKLAERFPTTAFSSFAFEDGSGLAPTGLASASDLATLLRAAASRPWFPRLIATLPGPSEGTLQGWPRLPAGIRAKTGTLRRHVALAGYLRRSDGSLIAFAALVGPVLDDQRGARRWIAEQLGQIEGARRD